MMNDNAQQQSQSVKKQGKSSSNVRTETQNDSRGTVLCPNCSAELPEEALFCPECGASIKQRKCPNCGAANPLSADICQICKAWLLEGQCKFCYAEVSDEASFCPECGKPKDGIPCPHCGNLSIFDFCAKCGKPVTEEAAVAVQTAHSEVNNPVPADTQTATIEAEIAKLDSLINSESEPKVADVYDSDDVYDPDGAYEEEPEVFEDEPVRKSFFSDRQMAAIRQTGADIDKANQQRAEQARIAEEKRKEAVRIAEERRKAVEARKIAAEKERQRQICEAQAQKEALQRKLEQERMAAAAAAIAARKVAAMAQAQQNASKRFSTPQEARRWHFAHRHPDALGWLCNYAGCVHLYSDGGPDNCHVPTDGGRDFFGTINDIYRDDNGYWYPR
jgi:hypothetical protein